MFRLQKVLLAEYEEIYEPLLVENPIVLVDFQGTGLRQYQMGLTCNHLLFGCDKIVESSRKWSWLMVKGQDHEIESFELTCILPLQFLRFHFYRKGSRYLMMITAVQPSGQPVVSKEQPMIFEFGGHRYRQHYWHTWRERVASIRAMQTRYNHITGASPFSSTDVLLEDEIITVAQVHRRPQTPSLCSSLCRLGV
ncbi:hypothetical protein KR054_003557 [Drosophila jambulina]|nr:hypothetical protein KR054_003557 [Drosophila jambulina]